LNDFYSEKPRESCGLFGIHDHLDAAKLTYFGLYALQHRGQESAGIAVVDNNTMRQHKGMGLVADVFNMPQLEQLKGRSAIGHVRYSTTGSSILSNAQPLMVQHRQKTYAVAHNGNLVNAHTLRNELEETGSIFQTTMDSEVFLHLLKTCKRDLSRRLLKVPPASRALFPLSCSPTGGNWLVLKTLTAFVPCVSEN
jgi:amidophosphoribosyltransferase